MSHRFMIGVCGSVAATLGFAVSALAAAPTLRVVVGDDSVRIEPHETPARGAVRLALRRDAGDPRTIAVVELKPGRTRGELARIPLAGLADVSRLRGIGRLVAGITVGPGSPATLTIRARARRHVLVDVTRESNPSAELVVDRARDGAALARPDAAIALTDAAIRLPATLPRAGRIRVRNVGRRPHHAMAILLRRGVEVREARRHLLAGKAIERLGAPVDLMGLISPGAFADVERRLAPGRYLVASFYAGKGRRAQPDVFRGLLAATRVR